MLNLIKLDFKRFIRDKSLIVLGAMIVVFAVFTDVILRVVTNMPEFTEMTGISFGPKEIVLNALSPSSDIGLMIPIFMAMIIIKDFKQGTVRNKLIIGKPRSLVFISDWIVAVIVGTCAYLLYAFINMGLGIALFGGLDAVEGGVGGLITRVLLAALVYTVFISAIVFLACSIRNLGITIAIGVLGSLVVSLAANLPDMAQTLPDIIVNIGKAAPSYQIVQVANGVIDSALVMKSFVMTGVYSVVFVGLGLFFINNSDIN